MIFNKNGIGIKEMRNHAGMIDGSIPFENIKSEIILATEEIIKIVGKEIVNAADVHYNSDRFCVPNQTNKEKLLDTIVDYIQLPIALLSIISYMDSNDVSHDDSGRKMRLAEGEKIPFQWLLERDSKIMLQKANKSIDRLIALLDENKDNEPVSDTYATSKEFKIISERFIRSAKEFDNIFPIDESRQFFMRISSFMKSNELKHIIPLITTEKYEELKEKITDDEEKTSDEEIMISYIQNIVVYLSLKDACERLSANYLPDSISEGSFLDNIGAKTDRRKELVQHFTNLATSEIYNFQKWISSKEETLVDEYIKDLSEEKFYRP